jgi:subtilisin-like proprotein convertase family protein
VSTGFFTVGKIMGIKTASKKETKLGRGLKRESEKARYRTRRKLAVVLLGVLGLSVTMQSARAETLTITNPTSLTTPDSGIASLYPSQAAFDGFPGRITAVRVTLHNITHTFPDDYDILLGRQGFPSVMLMSDCGDDPNLNNVTVTFSDVASASLPDSGQITTGTYRPSNYNGTFDTFPPDPTQAYSTSLAAFNNTTPNAAWSLYVVDDATGDSGTIAGGWTLELDTTGFRGGAITVPDSGPGSPYPSQISVGGLPQTIRKMRVTLFLTHTFPDDLDIMLVGPGGQNALIMSDVGGDVNASGVGLTLDDAAANSLPDEGLLVAGTFKPTNSGTGDAFPGPAPASAGTSALSVFDGTNPNGTWRLFVVDDATGDMGNISSWRLEFDLEPIVLANISTRMRVETGDNVLIGGFIVTGTQPKRVIVRAIGPSIPLPGVIPDPTLELRDGNGALVRFNDDWRVGNPPFPSQEAEIIATGLAPANNGESAIIATLPANNAGYTAIVRGFNNATGIGVVEAYDLDRTVDSKFVNISTRGLVQTGDNVMIAGIIVQGALLQKVIVRALGPSIPLGGTLADPSLELRDGNGALIASNDDWIFSGQQSDIFNTGLPPPHNREAAIVAGLPAGAYTAIVRGVNGTTGVALVEAYALN